MKLPRRACRESGVSRRSSPCATKYFMERASLASVRGGLGAGPEELRDRVRDPLGFLFGQQMTALGMRQFFGAGDVADEVLAVDARPAQHECGHRDAGDLRAAVRLVGVAEVDEGR